MDRFGQDGQLARFNSERSGRSHCCSMPKMRGSRKAADTTLDRIKGRMYSRLLEGS